MVQNGLPGSFIWLGLAGLLVMSLFGLYGSKSYSPEESMHQQYPVILSPSRPRIMSQPTKLASLTDQSRPKYKEELLLASVIEQAKYGDPESVMHVIDTLAWNQWFMNVGDVKGKILDDAIRARAPKLVLELGAYCGYSATRIARLLPADGRLISIEIDPLHAAIATKVVEHAGLSNKVTILVGTLEGRIPFLQNHLGINNFDLVFLDHHKDAYHTDLLLLEKSQLIVKGTVLVADNVIYPGCPKYVEYVRAHPETYSTVFHDSLLEYTKDQKDGIEVSTRLV